MLWTFFSFSLSLYVQFKIYINVKYQRLNLVALFSNYIKRNEYVKIGSEKDLWQSMCFSVLLCFKLRRQFVANIFTLSHIVHYLSSASSQKSNWFLYLWLAGVCVYGWKLWNRYHGRQTTAYRSLEWCRPCLRRHCMLVCAMKVHKLSRRHKHIRNFRKVRTLSFRFRFI